MNPPLSKLEKRIRFSAVLILIALLGTLASLVIAHPLSFIAFAIIGIFLTLMAIIYYLIALVRGSGVKASEKIG